MNRTGVRRVVLTIAVALLVATAGCSGLTGSEDPETTTDTGEPENEETTTTSDDGTAGAELDGQALTDATASAIESAGSYTAEQSARFASSQGTSETSGAIQVDFANERGLREVNRTTSGLVSSEQSVTVFTDGNTSYRRQIVDGNVTYDTQEGQPTTQFGIAPVNTSGFNQNYTSLIDGLAWEQNGTEEVDGVTATRYTVTGVEDPALLGNANTTVNNETGTLLVEDDVVREVSVGYEIEGPQGTARVDATLSVSDIGSTTVPEPDWLSEIESES